MSMIRYAVLACAGLVISISLNAVSMARADGLIDPTAIDASVNPCDDFYQYACGAWIQRTQIPSDQARWYRSFSVLLEKNRETLHGLLENYSHGKNEPNVPYSQKLGDFYTSCMNQQQLDKQSPAAVVSIVQRVNAIKNKSELSALVAQLHLEGVNSLFGFSNSPDLKDPTVVIAHLEQSGLTLPDKSYYTGTDAASLDVLAKFKSHIQKMFEFAGYLPDDASRAAQQAYDFEMKIANLSLPSEALHDETKLYHIQATSVLQSSLTAFNWFDYIQSLGINTPATLNVAEPEFFTGINTLVQDSDLPTIKAYLVWQNLEQASEFLGEPFYSEWFQFEKKTLGGQKAPMARWKTCVTDIGDMSTMGDALGNAFVAATFSPQAKTTAQKMINNIEAAFGKDLSTLPWLDESTRKAALIKLGLFSDKIGYPEKWKNFDTLDISQADFFQNVRNATKMSSLRELKKIGGPNDPKEWGMTPQTVNAYYSPPDNQINFPAAILQHPFFVATAHDAENYGAIGMVIGHEMTHGFDTTGSKFDGHGRMSYWWSDQVKKTFNEKASCLINQYSSYNALPGLPINGKLTITENIADNGGLKLSYAAYRASRQGIGEEPPIAGLNGSQQFFVAFAQEWCGKQMDAYTKVQVASDPHSPARYRVIGPASNNQGFAEAFNCQPGSKMAPANRCQIW